MEDSKTICCDAPVIFSEVDIFSWAICSECQKEVSKFKAKVDPKDWVGITGNTGLI